MQKLLLSIMVLGLAFGIYSCSKKRVSTDVSQSTQRAKVEDFIRRLRDNSSRMENSDQIAQDFKNMSNEEYDIYFEIGKEEAINRGISQAEIQTMQAEKDLAITLSMELFQKYPHSLNEEEWKIYDPALTAKRNQKADCKNNTEQKASCPTQSFSYETSVGSNSNRTSSNNNLVKAQ